MSRAKIGISAVAPPNSTQRRSSVITPRTASLCQMKRTPPRRRVPRTSGSRAPLRAARAAGSARRRARRPAAPPRRANGTARPDQIEQPAERRAEDHRRLRGERVGARRRAETRAPAPASAATTASPAARRRGRRRSPRSRANTAHGSARAGIGHQRQREAARALDRIGRHRRRRGARSGRRYAPPGAPARPSAVNCTRPMRPRSNALSVSA